MRFAGVSLFAVIGVFNVTCGGSTPAGEDVSPDTVGKKFAETFCGAKVGCCEAQGNPLSAEGLDLCRQLAPGAVAGHSGETFNRRAAVECLKAAGAYRCVDGRNLEDLCESAFVGTVALGLECFLDRDCAQLPDADVICFDQKCTVTNLYGREGAPCTDFRGDRRHVCAYYEGFTCVADVPGGREGTCRRLSVAGGRCVRDDDCTYGHYCNKMSNVCTPWTPPGAACDLARGFECEQSTNCEDGTCVVGTPGLCRAY